MKLKTEIQATIPMTPTTSVKSKSTLNDAFVLSSDELHVKSKKDRNNIDKFLMFLIVFSF